MKVSRHRGRLMLTLDLDEAARLAADLNRAVVLVAKAHAERKAAPGDTLNSVIAVDRVSGQTGPRTLIDQLHFYLRETVLP